MSSRRPAARNLREHIDRLRAAGELVEVEVEVDPRFELAEIHRRVIAAGGPALLFSRVKGSDIPVVTNLFGTRRRIDLAFGSRPERATSELARLVVDLMPPSPAKLFRERRLLGSLLRVGTRKRRGVGALTAVDAPARLTRLPALTTWEHDGGPFLTLPLVYTEHPATGVSNLGIYRMQVYDDVQTGMHIQINRGAGFHLARAEEMGRPLPANVFLGGSPSLMLAALAPLPENIPELLLASLLQGAKIRMVSPGGGGLPWPAECEIVLRGEIPPGVRRPEGPFGDHYGYYSLTHDYPVFNVKEIRRRPNAVFPATVVGKPRQEDYYLGDYVQDLLSPFFPIAMPGVRKLWSYGETGYHGLAAAVVHERYRREAMTQAFRILGEGQLGLTKFLFCVSSPLDLRDFPALLEHVLCRTDPRTDLFCFANLSMDSLDYAGPVINEGSKGVWLGIGEPRRELPREFRGRPPAGVESIRVFCGGCLVVSGPTHADEPGFASRLAAAPELAEWPLVVLLDDAERATRSSMNFLWTTFTRFDPASDLHCAETKIVHNHRPFAFPVILDARMKSTYPDELFCDPVTADRVTRRWREYFPPGVEMGDSDAAHLD